MTSHSFAVNRMEPERTAIAPASGASAESSLSGAPVTLRKTDFDKFIVCNGVPLVVHFWARWCSLSRAMAPHLTAGARRFAGQALFVRVELDDESHLAARYEVQSVPTVILFCNGQESDRHSGAMSAGQLERWLRPHLDKDAGPAA
jgi:thioredoxin 2